MFQPLESVKKAADGYLNVYTWDRIDLVILDISFENINHYFRQTNSFVYHDRKRERNAPFIT